MKVTYTAYRKFCQKHPEAAYRGKIIPGDNVEVADKFADFFKKEEIVLEAGEPEDPKLAELGKQRIAVKKAKQAQIDERIRQIHVDDDEVKKEEKRDDFILPLEDNTKKLVEYKLKLQKRDDLTKLEKKKKLAEYKASLEEKLEEKKPKRQKRTQKKKESKNEKGRLVKDPETGEFKREG